MESGTSMKHDERYVSRAQEDFLKTTYLLLSLGKPAKNSEIAQALDISSAAVSIMSKRLSELDMIVYRKYQEVELTEKGRMVALEILRHHRLLELFFTETLNLPWDVVHRMADRMEHDLDEMLEDAIDAFLDSPRVDCHGDPIPAKDGTVTVIPSIRLTEIPIDTTRRVTRVLTQEPERLAYLGNLGLYPRTAVTVVEKQPFNGPLRILIDDAETIIGYEIASLVELSVASPDSQSETHSQ